MSSEQGAPRSGVDVPAQAQVSFAKWYVLPCLAVLVLFFLPLVLGSHTLFLRDVMNTHLEMKWWQAQAMDAGYLPLVDPMRSGGQPHLGNPNSVALYPDNVLYLVAPFFWAFNAHFWLHALLAVFTMYWLGRRLGLGRPGAWAAGIAYVGGGYFLSQLNLYNLVAGAALLPALGAATSKVVAEKGRGWSLPVVAVIWCLMILAGDPMTAAIGLLMALTLAWVNKPSRETVVRFACGLAAGTLLALPLLVEFWRILSLSFRGHWGYSSQAATATSWHPMALLEWFIPLAFGAPGATFWGARFHSAAQPLFYSLFPGVLVLGLAIAGATARVRATRWALVLGALGLLAALGKYNPIMVWLLELPGFSVLRLPIKFWPLVAVPIAVLAGHGFERAFSRTGLIRLRAALAALAALYLALWLVSVLWPGPLAALIASWMPSANGVSGFAMAEASRWSKLALQLSAFSILATAACFVRSNAFHRVAPLLLALSLAYQLTLLGALFPNDGVANYQADSEVGSLVPRGANVVHADSSGLLGQARVSLADFPDLSPHWLQRRVHRDLYPYVGIMSGLRYEFALSPEGLDGFLTRTTAQAMAILPPARKIRLLAASGVDWLLTKKRLQGLQDSELVALQGAIRDEVFVYRIQQAAPEAYAVGELLYSENLNEAVTLVTDPAFRPSEQVVLAGTGPPGGGLGGAVELLLSKPEFRRWKVTIPGPGAFVWQRAFLPLYRARVDGRDVEPVAANMHRMAVLLEAGEHEVEIWVDRRPVTVAFAVAMLTGLALALYGLRSARGHNT